MSTYLDAYERYTKLKSEYDRKVAQLDPLRLKMLQAKAEADKEWRILVYNAQTSQDSK